MFIGRAVGGGMESNARYWWRRARQELDAASRAVTPAATERHMELAETYLQRLRELGDRSPIPASALSDLACYRPVRISIDESVEWPVQAGAAAR